MIYSITDKRLFNVIDVIMREEFGNYTIIDNVFYAEHGFFSVEVAGIPPSKRHK